MTTPPWLGNVLAALTGVLVFIAYPDWNHNETAWFAFVPLLFAAREATVRRGFALGLVAGTVTNFGGFHWITWMLSEFGHLPAPVSWAILLLQAVTQGLAMAVGVALWRFLARRGAPSALTAFLALWAGECVTPMIFPWFMGNAISDMTPMVQIADLGGVPLVSALIYAVNAALAELTLALTERRRPALRFVVATALAVLATWGYGTWRIGDIEAREAAAKTLKIGLVEGDVGIWEKEARHLDTRERTRTLRKNLLKHQRMSAQLEARGAELILWPESAYQPYGAIPAVHTADRFLAVGAGGAVLHHRDGVLVSAQRGKEGLPRTTGLLTGLSSPRGDLWRALLDGREVVTVSPWGTSSVALPKGVQGVDTATGGVTLFGKSKPGYVLGRRGRVWRLDWPDEPLERVRPLPAPARPELAEVPAIDVGAVDMTAAACNGAGDLLAVGRKGALLRLAGHSVQPQKSPVSVDLWAVSGDPLGRNFVAVGAKGTILTGTTDRLRVEHRGGPDLFAAWFDADGRAWAAGADGRLMRRRRGGSWAVERAPAQIDLLAGAADARGHQLVIGRGGRAWERDRKGRWTARRRDGTELTSVLGFQPRAALVVPRGAKRIVPARRPLPKHKDLFAAVDADSGTDEFDRNTPRRGFRTPLLMGAMTHGGELPMRNAECKACFNSALLLGSDGEVLDLVDKTFLLVFGEYIPFGEQYPKLYDLLPESSRFQAGTRTRPVSLGPARIGVMICYEDLLHRHAMRIAAHDPNVFVNLTNDAWFGQTAEPHHHLQLAQLRTVEYRRWLVRSTNTGVSVFVDALGRRVKQTKLTGAETLMHAVPLLEGRTVYAALGDWTFLALAVALLLLWARALREGGGAGGRRRGGAGGKKRGGSGRGPKSPSSRASSPRASAKSGKSAKSGGAAGGKRGAAKGGAAKGGSKPKGKKKPPEVLEPGSLR